MKGLRLAARPAARSAHLRSRPPHHSPFGWMGSMVLAPHRRTCLIPLECAVTPMTRHKIYYYGAKVIGLHWVRELARTTLGGWGGAAVSPAGPRRSPVRLHPPRPLKQLDLRPGT